MVPEKIKANTSASQHKTKRSCTRKWAFERIGKMAPRSGHHFVVGHVLHSIAERYLLRQSTTWAGLFPPGWNKDLEPHEADWMKLQAELAITKGMWQSSDNLAVEYPLVLLVGEEHLDHRGMPKVARATTFTDAEGVRRHGKPQSLYDGSPLPPGWDRLPPFVGFIDVLHLHSTPAQIEDHKTAKNKKYALTSEKLAQDLQVNAYAALPLSLRPDLDQVRLRHNVFLKDPEAKTPCYPVTAYTNAPMVARQWRMLIEEAEEMERLRNEYTAESFAVNWHKVPCAIDAGKTKDACEAYGGCPYRDVCFGRCTVEQLSTRLKSPDPIKAMKARQDAMSFNSSTMRAKWLAKARTDGELPAVPTLKVDDTTESDQPQQAPATKERLMPFSHHAPAPKPFAVHDEVYLADPDDAGVQYKASITNAGFGEPGQPKKLMVALWPSLAAAPDLLTLGKAYHVPEIAMEDVSRTQLPVRQLVGYEEVARKLGMYGDADLVWKPRAQPVKTLVPAPAAAPSPAAAASTAKVAEREAHDGSFNGGFRSRVAAPAAPAAAAPVVPQPAVPTSANVPQPTYQAKIGQTLRVLANLDNPFWAALAGKLAVVDDVTLGEHGDMLTVAIDNKPYPEVAAGRFELVSEPAGPVPPVVYLEEGERVPAGVIVPPAPKEPTLADFQALVGKVVSVRMIGGGVPINGTLEKVHEAGIEMMGGNYKAGWDKIEAIEVFDAARHQPGYQPPKPTKEEKAAAKEAEKQRKLKEKMDAAAKKVADREAEKERVKAEKAALKKAEKDAAKGGAGAGAPANPPAGDAPATPPAPPAAPAAAAPATPPAPPAPTIPAAPKVHVPLFSVPEIQAQARVAFTELERLQRMLGALQ